MTNRLELNWKVDGIVDEQRYYCSETPFTSTTLPAAKAVLLNTDRTYVDTDIDEDKLYYVAVSSVRNGVEKVSDEVIVSTFPKVPAENIVTLLNFENGLVDATGKRIWTSSNANVAKVVDTNLLWGSKALSILGTALGEYIYTNDSADFWFSDADFGIEASLFLLSKNEFHTILSQRQDYAVQHSFCFYYFNGNFVFEYSTNGSTVISVVAPFVLSVSKKIDVQCIRLGSSLQIAVDGVVLIDHNIGTAILFNSPERIVVGQLNSSLSGGKFDGYIDELRVTKGFSPAVKVKRYPF